MDKVESLCRGTVKPTPGGACGGFLLIHIPTHILAQTSTRQVVLRVNLKQDSDEFKEVKQALEEVVEQHRELVNPQRNWKSAAYQLVSLAVLIGTLLHFTRHDMLSG